MANVEHRHIRKPRTRQEFGQGLRQGLRLMTDFCGAEHGLLDVDEEEGWDSTRRDWQRSFVLWLSAWVIVLDQGRTSFWK